MVVRRKFDAYFTPSWATKVLLDHIDIKEKNILEPCVGEGNIERVLADHTDIIVTNDIDSSRFCDSHFDASNPLMYKDTSFDWIITNPPFSNALDIVKLGVENGIEGAAFLLRLTFLEPTIKRQDWLSKCPPNKILVLPRISFTGDGKTDSVTCAWFIWDKTGENYVKVIKKNEH